VIIDKLSEIIGFFGVIAGIEIIAIVLFSASILYFRNPIVAGVIGNMSSLSMSLGYIGYSIRNERKKLINIGNK
jgi:hypothetical protein